MASKFGYGNIGDIDQAIEDGKLDGQDLVITKDTSELVYITSDKKKKVIKTKPLVFNSVTEATTYVNTTENIPNIYLGQQVLIKNENNEYVTYTIQQENSSYIVKLMVPESGLVWQTF